MTDADDARFLAFKSSTSTDERDWIAFLEFEEAIDRAVMCATMFNPYDADPGYEREHQDLKVVLGEMLYRVLPRVHLGTLLTQVEGIGYALLYGLIGPQRTALDDITDTDAYEALADRGYTAQEAANERRLAERRALEPEEDDD